MLRGQARSEAAFPTVGAPDSGRGIHFGRSLVEDMGIEPDEKHPGWAGTIREPDTGGESAGPFTGGTLRIAIHRLPINRYGSLELSGHGVGMFK